jgi:rubrerythrin
MSATTLERTDRDFFGSIRELFCRECGYGIVVRRDPPECPMCRSTTWSDRPRVARWN